MREGGREGERVKVSEQNEENVEEEKGDGDWNKLTDREADGRTLSTK